MPFKIIQQDITTIKADAIVNAANTNLKMGGGVSGAIFQAAGAEELQAACDNLAPIKTGEAVITPGFDLPAKNIIHTAGPVYQSFNKNQSEQLLREAYINSLQTAVDNNCKSIAFPLISSGIYGYPKDEALQVALAAIKDFLKQHDLDVTLVVFNKSAFNLSQKLLADVDSFLDKHFLGTFKEQAGSELLLQQDDTSLADRTSDSSEFVDFLSGQLTEPFSDQLMRLLEARKISEQELYKRANIKRELFDQIINNKKFKPNKRIVLSLAIALELSWEETEIFLKRSGYAFSNAVKSDVIVKYFLSNKKYDIYEINEILFAYDQPLLGGW